MGLPSTRITDGGSNLDLTRAFNSMFLLLVIYINAVFPKKPGPEKPQRTVCFMFSRGLTSSIMTSLDIQDPVIKTKQTL